jgi:hypothetical protein
VDERRRARDGAEDRLVARAARVGDGAGERAVATTEESDLSAHPEAHVRERQALELVGLREGARSFALVDVEERFDEEPLLDRGLPRPARAMVGGARAAVGMALRMRLAMSWSVTTARTSRRPPQRGQALTSTSKVLASKVAHGTFEVTAKSRPPPMRSRCLADRTFGNGTSAP